MNVIVHTNFKSIWFRLTVSKEKTLYTLYIHFWNLFTRFTHRNERFEKKKGKKRKIMPSVPSSSSSPTMMMMMMMMISCKRRFIEDNKYIMSPVLIFYYYYFRKQAFPGSHALETNDIIRVGSTFDTFCALIKKVRSLYLSLSLIHTYSYTLDGTGG